MPLEIKKESICFSELFTKSKCEQAVSLEINLPDYCGDIKRILKCIVTAGVSGISLSGETVTVTGSVVTRLFYVGDNDKADCYEHTSSLSCNTQIKNLPENPIFRVVTKTDYINCRAVSQRKISISGSIGAMIYVYTENKSEVPCDISGLSVQCRKKKKNITNLICHTEKTFDLSETLALDSEKPDIGKIIRSDCYMRLDSKKAVADKLLIKGELCCDILYTDSEKSSFTKLTHTMPVSQIISLAGVTDKSDIHLCLSPLSFTVLSKNDSSGRCRLLEIAARLSALVRCSEEKEITVIDDCYCIKHNVAGEYRLSDFSRTVMNEDKEICVEETIDFSDSEISSIKDMWCSNLSCTLREKDGNVQGEYTFLLCGIYTDSAGNIRYGEKNVSHKITLPVNCRENINCECMPSVTKLSWSHSGKSVKIKADSVLNCMIASKEPVRLLCEIKVDENTRKEDVYPALSLYFAKKDEEIWDIARRYNTTVNLIKEENAISGDKTEKDIMIMIPCV